MSMLKINHDPVSTQTIITPQATVQGLFIAYDGTICTEGERALGVSYIDVNANDACTYIYLGIAPVVAGENISVGAAVASDANGKAKTAEEGDVVCGYAVSAGTTNNYMQVKLTV